MPAVLDHVPFMGAWVPTLETLIHCYAETREGDGTWHADAAASFIQDPPTPNGWVQAHMTPVPCPRHAGLFGLLCDQVHTTWRWSFIARDLPRDLSWQVQALATAAEISAYGHTHIDLQELLDKSIELMTDGSPEAWLLNEQLQQVIRGIVTGTSDRPNPEDHRIVLWFTD